MTSPTFLAPLSLLAALAACVASLPGKPAATPGTGSEPLPPATAGDVPEMKPQPNGPDLGFLGYQPPEVGSIVMADAVPHQDTVGGAHQVLTAVTGGAQGFAVVWRDPRDGSTGLYVARYDTDLVAREPERPTSKPHTMRRTEPAVALAPDGSLAVTWTGVVGRGSIPFLRLTDAQGRARTDELWAAAPLALAPGEEQRGRGDASDASCRAPDVLHPTPERTVLAWLRGARVQWLDLDAGTDYGVRPVGTALDVDPNGATATAPLHLAAGADGTVVVLWNTTEKGPRLSVRRGAGFATRAVGDGIADAFVADPRGGYWLLVRTPQGSALRRVSKDLRVEGRDLPVVSGAVARQDLALFDGGLAVLVVPAGSAEGARGGAVAETDVASDATRLYLFDEAGAPLVGFDPAGLAVVPAGARSPQGARLASDGRRLLVAWTDLRAGDGDVYGRLVDPRADASTRLGVEKRLNTDTASSDQVQPCVAAAGERGVVAWVDRRAPPARLYARRVGRTGFEGGEILLPVARAGETLAAPGGGAQRPAAAVRVDGEALVAWRVNVGRGLSRLVAQVLRADGSARSGLVVLDEGAEGEPGDVAVTALTGERGYVIAWPRAGGRGMWCRRLNAAGEAQGILRRVDANSDESLSDAALATLDDGRVLAAWTADAANGVSSVRGRLIKENGEAVGDEIAFEHSRPVSDWDPAIAPASDGGFLLAWTSGARTDPVRDVVVRLYDAQGRPRHGLLVPCLAANEQDFPDVARLADGTFAVAWEDDVSYADQCYVRRVSGDGTRLGRMCRLNAEETAHMPDRVTPRIARFGAGFLVAFGDRRRSQGFDVRVKIVGAGWDVGLPPDPPAQGPPR